MKNRTIIISCLLTAIIILSLGGFLLGRSFKEEPKPEGTYVYYCKIRPSHYHNVNVWVDPEYEKYPEYYATIKYEEKYPNYTPYPDEISCDKIYQSR